MVQFAIELGDFTFEAAFDAINPNLKVGPGNHFLPQHSVTFNSIEGPR